MHYPPIGMKIAFVDITIFEEFKMIEAAKNRMSKSPKSRMFPASGFQAKIKKYEVVH